MAPALGLVLVAGFASFFGSVVWAQPQQRPPTDESASKKAVSIRASIAVAQLSRTQATDFLSGLNSQSATNKTIVLDPPEARRQLELLRRLGTARYSRFDETSAVTVAGVPTRIHVGAATNITERPQGTGAVHTNEAPLGVVIDFTASPDSNGTGITLTVTTYYNQFLGYDDPGQFVPQLATDGTPSTATLPRPHFLLRKIIVRTVTVPDGKTAVLGGSEEFYANTAAALKGVPVLGEMPGEPRKTFGKEAGLILLITPHSAKSEENSSVAPLK